MPKKIVFAYFAPSYIDYVPLDLGTIMAIIRKEGFRYDLHAIRIGYNEKDPVEKIMHLNPCAVFISLDSILWSGVYAIAPAKAIADKLDKNIFIGFCTHKIGTDTDEALESADCIVTSPECSFKHLDSILDKEKVPGVITSEHKDNQRLDVDISSLPSPYLEGIFDKFLATRRKGFSAFISTSKGCQYGCYYCFRSVKHDKLQFFDVKRVYDEIEHIMNLGINDFFVIDDCFLTSLERLNEFLNEFTKRKQNNPALADISIGIMCRPDMLTKEVVEIFSKLNIRFVQLGLQTINPELQHYMAREIDYRKFEEIAAWFTRHGIRFSVDVIWGLPDDTIEYFKKTLDYAISLGPVQIQSKQLYLNAYTKFYTEKKKYGIETRRKGLGAPYVTKAAGIDENYKHEAYESFLEKKAEHPEIKWRWSSEYGTWHDEHKRT